MNVKIFIAAFSILAMIAGSKVCAFHQIANHEISHHHETHPNVADNAYKSFNSIAHLESAECNEAHPDCLYSTKFSQPILRDYQQLISVIVAKLQFQFAVETIDKSNHSLGLVVQNWIFRNLIDTSSLILRTVILRV